MRLGPETRLYVSVSARPGNFGATVYAELFRRLSIDAVYLPRPAPPRAHQITDAMRALAIDGCSVSSPHKAAVMQYVNAIAPTAQAAGAINTIVREPDGRLTGHCTDVDGVCGALQGQTITSALIFGNGGVVGPAVAALRSIAVERIAICARDSDRAARTAKALGVESLHLPEALQERFDVLINATPGGREPDDTPELFELLTRAGGLLDMPVAMDDPTALHRCATNAGLWVRSGVDMCVHQIAAQAQLYLRPDTPIDTTTIYEILGARSAAQNGA